MDKVIFWDFDGTLSYPNRSFETALFTAASDLGHTLDREASEMFLMRSYSWKTPDEVYPGRTHEKWWDTMYTKLRTYLTAGKIDESAHIDICRRFREILTDVSNYRLYDDTAEVLEKVRSLGYGNCLVTNNYPEITDNLTKLGIAKYFDGMAVSSHIGYEKPRREFFAHALELTGRPHIGYMVGDNPKADIEGGKAAGLTTIAVHECRVSSADHYCAHLTEIPVLIQ